MRPPLRSTALRLALGALALAAAGPAAAAPAGPTCSPEDLQTAKGHYQAGLEAYKGARYGEAAQGLLKAYTKCPLPAILFNMGQTYRQLGQREKAIRFFEKFLAEAPPGAPNRPEAEQLLGELKTGGGVAASAPVAPAPPPAGGPPPAPASAPAATPAASAPTEPEPLGPRYRLVRRAVAVFGHEPVEEAPPRRPLDVRAETPEIEGLKVTLFYRAPGRLQFAEVPMQHYPTGWIGRIPARQMADRSIQYYIEARDATGRPFGNSGSAASPNIVLIAEGAKERFYGDLALPIGAEPDAPEDGRPRRNLLAWKWVATGIAAAGIGAGIGFLAYAKVQSDNLSADAGQQFRPGVPGLPWDSSRSDVMSMGTTNTSIGIATLVIGGAAAGAAIALWVLDESSKIERPAARKRPSAPVDTGAGVFGAPMVGDGTLGITGGFQF